MGTVQRRNRGEHGEVVVGGRTLMFRESPLNPRALQFDEPDLPDTGEPVGVDLGRTGKVEFGSILSLGDSVLLNLHREKGVGAVSSCGWHRLVVIPGAQLSQIEWTIKKTMLKGLRLDRLTVLACPNERPDTTVAIEMPIIATGNAGPVAMIIQAATRARGASTPTLPNGPGTHSIDLDSLSS